MIGIAGIEKSDYFQMIVVKEPKYNRMWGADYLLMDSNSFMGRIGGSGYENVIEMFDNMWKVNGYNLLTNFLQYFI